jgi:hypothetical protein
MNEQNVGQNSWCYVWDKDGMQSYGQTSCLVACILESCLLSVLSFYSIRLTRIPVLDISYHFILVEVTRVSEDGFPSETSFL